MAIPEAWLDILDESVKHRGPDGHGRFRDRAIRPDGSLVDVALVHRRLSIIDHACGHQPMVLPAQPIDGFESLAATQHAARSTRHDPVPYRRTLDHALNPCPRCAGQIAVVFNGCIYNHRELRKELQAAGHVFSTDHSDTEVLVHGWSQWHEHLTERLDGMYTAAIWDGPASRLAMIRDRAGEKPLFEGVDGGALLVFGSTVPAVIRAMRAAGMERVTGIPEAWMLNEWIRNGHFERPPTAWVHEVQPRDLRVFGDHGFSGQVAIHSGQPLPDRRADATLDASDADRLIRDAVRTRVEADVPLGCFLSGGIDSSLVALHAHRALGGLKTFTVRMPDRRFDESSYAEAVARHVGTRHSTLECSPRPAQDLVAIIRQIGVPFGDSSLLPTYWVSAATRSHVTVALGGDGGDELFCGYERYAAMPMLRRWRSLLAAVPSGVLPRREPASAGDRLARLAEAARFGEYDELVSIFPTPSLTRLLGNEAGRPSFSGDEPNAPGRDFASYLPQDLLRKTDAAAMAVALELRSPFLATQVVGRCLAEPLSSLMPRGQRKGLLRAVARKYFPPEIVDRPKQGFAIPVGDWFRTDYGGMRQLLLDHLGGPEPFGPDRLGINSMINMAFVKQMLREHDDAGGKSIWPWKGRDHSQRLYMLLVLSIWGKWLGSL